MIYDWYKIINKATFEATGLASREVTVILGDLGQKTVLVTKGNYVSLVYEGVMLSLQMTGTNPFKFENKAVYLDANDDIWLGFLNED